MKALSGTKTRTLSAMSGLCIALNALSCSTDSNGGGAGAAGVAGSSGSVGAGGAQPNGGSGPAAGGTNTAGGNAPAGGTTGDGGTINASAGGSGGAAPTAGTGGGGTTGGGGSAGAGGMAGSGGMAGTGTGAGGAGGAAPASGTPKLVSTIDIRAFSGCPGLRFGDLNGDGRLEIVMAQPVDQATLDAYTPQRVVAVTALDLKGKQLWQRGTPGNAHRASSDIPIQVYDMDGDGKSEVFVNMSTTAMSVLDGATGNLLRTIPLPVAGSNDSIAIANLRGKPWPQDLIVKTRYSQFWAITGIDDETSKAGTVLWTHVKGPATGFSDLSTGHFPLVYDWNGDGKDEVMGGYDFMDSSGNTLWSTNVLALHADAIATADLDGNPANGYEIVIGGDVAAAFDWKTGRNLWKDNHTVEVQQIAIGEYRTDLPGLEVALLDRIGPRNETGVDANLLVDQHDQLLWKETRPTGAGWLTVTENLTNWDGKGTDHIFSYRRGAGGAFLYDGYNKVVANFPYPGSSDQNFGMHADLCGDSKEEVIVYDEQTLWLYANDGCDLDAAPAKPSRPQQYRLYNWSIYTGWINPDVTFYTPGSQQ